MLDRLQRKPGSKRPRRRLGRGIGSGLGKTSGRGQKGAGARSGHKSRPWVEGGQMPLLRRLPKRGFHNPFSERSQVVNLGALSRFGAGADVGPEALAQAGLIRSAAEPVKILAEGDLAVALRLRVHAASAAAQRKIEAAGGSIELLASGTARKGEEPSA